MNTNSPCALCLGDRSFAGVYLNMEQNTIPSDAFFESLRRKEYARLDETKSIYLDYTGGNLFPLSLLEDHYHSLKSKVMGNPHSTNPSSRLSTRLVASARQKVLDYFNADDYYCIFTANASEALHIVGENYAFDHESIFLLTSDNHNSVNGIREYCHHKGGRHEYFSVNYEDLCINETALKARVENYDGHKRKLFAYPAQSNVSGVRHSLDLIPWMKEKGWDVLLDAAAFVPTSRLDLKKYHPDFVCLSFYKMFGYPTGIGCLLVRKDSFYLLHKQWFAGGTVTLVSVNYDSYYLAPDHERFENGTINYLGIPAIGKGLNFMESLGIERIHQRIEELTRYLIQRLETLKHGDGRPLIRIFGPADIKDRGGNIVLNFFDTEGKPWPFEIIEESANARNISVRTGCFCNPGIDEINNCLTSDSLAPYFASRDQGNFQDMVHFLGTMRGSIRLSVGIPTVKSDIDAFVDFAATYLNVNLVAGKKAVG